LHAGLVIKLVHNEQYTCSCRHSQHIFIEFSSSVKQRHDLS
jgi:hypothetical protein